MAGYAGSLPFEPFHVQAKVLKREEGGVVPPGSAPPPTPPERVNSSIMSNGGEPPLEALYSVFGRTVAAVLFGALYYLIEQNGAFCALAVLALLACTMFRLHPRLRGVVAAPLIMSSMLLARQVAEYFRIHPLYPLANVRPGEITFAPWLPLFFAVSLFFLPRRDTVTGKILLLVSVVMLAAGLLPGEGFAAIFVTTQYFLFIGLVVGLGIDFTQTATADRGHAHQEG